MSFTALVLRSLRYHWATHLALALGVAVGTAILTGALVVGDSMRGSLRHLALDRLGQVDQVLTSEHFFRAALADELAACDQYRTEQRQVVPAILLRASCENPDSQPPARANAVNLIGCDARFWQLGSGGPPEPPGRREIVLNRPLADQLGVAEGEEVLVRLPRPGAIPAESALGDKRETVRSERLRVRTIIEAEGLGRFSLRPSQRLPRNAYVSLETLQTETDETGRANLLLTTLGNATAATETTAPWPVPPRFTDLGLEIQKTKRGYLQITSSRMLIEPAAESAILDALAQAGSSKQPSAATTVQPALTYLANSLAADGRQVPYSTITAIDFSAEPPLGPFISPDGHRVAPLGNDEIALNAWAAADLGVKPGATIRVSYFEPESTHGQVREKTVSLRLASIVALEGPADDPSLTPTVRGITDQLSMSDWNPPFPFDVRRVRPADDQYWKKYRATPKAFVSLATGRRLWASRFGHTTSLRLPALGSADTHTKDSPQDASRAFESRIPLDPAVLGFTFQPIRHQALLAAEGTTPFNALFLGFSFFIIAAAVMLVALLFRLGLERRAKELGIFLAVGLPQRRVSRLFAAEGLCVAAVGSFLGVAGGIGYAALMLLGLRTWWLAAVSTPFLHLYATPASMAMGYAIGLAIAWAVIAWAARRIARLAPRQLLAGAALTANPPRLVPVAMRTVKKQPAPWLPIGLALTLTFGPAVALMIFPLDESVRAGAFFAAGGVALAAMLTLVTRQLRHGATGRVVVAGRGNLGRMALRSAARNPGRSALTIGLVAAASFLVAGTSAFQLDSSGDMTARSSASGGFPLLAESDQPIFADLNSPAGRDELGFSEADTRLLAPCRIYPLRVKPGDDASCLNLYQPHQPRLLGVSEALIERDGFAWADRPVDATNPWGVLQEDVDRRPVVPVILDKNTANYSLHLWRGRGESYRLTDSRGATLTTEVAGLLANSIFQGDLLIGEKALLDYDPAVSGYRLFLIEAPADQVTAVGEALERNLGDYGFAVQSTAERLADFAAVQNTYLATFQSLGGLGLLLGTVGLAVVQLRNVLERRGELALLRAAGFRRRQLARLVLLETAALLAAGLGIGLVAALAAVLPNLAGQSTRLPWVTLSGLLIAMCVAGLLAGLIAARAVLRIPLLAALREDR